MNATAVQSSVYQLPHRKPLPPAALPVRLHPTRAMPTEPPQSPVAQPLAPSTSGHNRSRLSTSSTFSSMTVAQSNARGPPNTNPVSYQAYMNQHNPTARRSLSNATASTSSTGGGGPVRQNSASSSNLQRTTSSRSGTSATSYVALMRRQKATVWCDRAQVGQLLVFVSLSLLTARLARRSTIIGPTASCQSTRCNRGFRCCRNSQFHVQLLSKWRCSIEDSPSRRAKSSAVRSGASHDNRSSNASQRERGRRGRERRGEPRFDVTSKDR